MSNGLDLDHAHDLVLAYVRNLEHALGLDHALDHALGLARTLAIELAVTLDFTRRLDRNRYRVRYHVRNLNHARNLGHTLDVVCNRVRNVALTLDCTLDLDRTSHLAYDVARARACAHVRDFGLAHNLDLDLDLDLTRLRPIAERLQIHIQLWRKLVGEAAEGDSNGFVVTKTSSRLTAWAVRLVPPAYREEYEEDFRSELYEVAAEGTGWWGQVRHCLRVLVRAPLLRRELLTPAPSARERSW